jgi:hypothetical protein
MSDDNLIITDDRHPSWRARLVVDEHCGQPWGDALAPALLIERRQAVWAREVYQPKHAEAILAAWHHFGADELFERYLRLAHGTTTIRHVTGQDLTVVIFDTADYRTRAGITGVCDLTGEHDEWRAWLDGDVVEQHTATDCWTVHDSLWGLYGHAYAEEQAQAMLAAAVPATA